LLSLCLAISFVGAQAEQETEPLPATGVGIHGVVIPVGFQQGQYSALVQIIADGSPLPGANWELQANPVRGIKDTKAISGELAVSEAGIPAVLEAQMIIAPGLYELALQAKETSAGQTAAGQLTGLLPDLDKAGITITPVAIVQPVEAVFLRGGEIRNRGALGREEEEPVLAELPTALVCLICRGPGKLDEVRVERELSGATSMKFSPIQVQLGDERCAQIRDLIQPGVMTDGFFRYDVRVFDSHALRVSGHRVFSAVTAGSEEAGPPAH
jgi:hypothetical protein